MDLIISSFLEVPALDQMARGALAMFMSNQLLTSFPHHSNVHKVYSHGFIK